LTFSLSDIDELNYWRFHHPDPLILKHCETVHLHSKGLKTGQIHDLTGRDVKTIRSHLHLFKDGGLHALLERDPYRPQSELEAHKTSIESEFRARPSASIKEAGDRIFKLTGIRRSESRIEAFQKRTGMKFRKTGGIPAKADIAKQEEFLKKLESCYKTGNSR
jgi:transposase